jgi:uncharacterized membrane protein YeaQ/YmgE (transglycosylase-associated protein family)
VIDTDCIARLGISNVPSIEEVKMNLSAIFVGILAALLAPVLVGVATAAGALLSLIQGIITATVRTESTSTHSTKVRSGKGAKVVKLPEERRSDEEFRSAA